MFPNSDYERLITTYKQLCVDLHFKVLGALGRCLGVDESAMHELCSQKTTISLVGRQKWEFLANTYIVIKNTGKLLSCCIPFGG